MEAAAADSVNIALVGFGAVNRTLCKLLLDLESQRGFSGYNVVGVSDSRGAVMTTTSSGKLDLVTLMKHKDGKKGLDTFALPNGFVMENSDDENASVEMAQNAPYDILVDGSPASKDGGTGLACIQAALGRSKHVVLANKSPLVVAFKELSMLAEKQGVKFEYSATVCGGLPVVNVARRDLVYSKITKLEGVFNSTSNYVLSQLAIGATKEAAILEAQQRGIAEADPTLDLEGWDTASKLVILANCALGMVGTTLANVTVAGVESITVKDIENARANGKIIKLVARATLIPEDSSYQLTVGPESVDPSSFIGQCADTEMCVAFYTDIFENIVMKTDEKGVSPTSAAVLRDLNTLTPQVLATRDSKLKVDGVDDRHKVRRVG